jgi:hypothetical protein
MNIQTNNISGEIGARVATVFTTRCSGKSDRARAAYNKRIFAATDAAYAIQFEAAAVVEQPGSRAAEIAWTARPIVRETVKCNGCGLHLRREVGEARFLCVLCETTIRRQQAAAIAAKRS